MRSSLVDVEVVLIHQTEKAWLVESTNTGKQTWIAKSMGELDENILTLPRRLAESKELV